MSNISKLCYAAAIRFEGSDPSGLLILAGDTILKLEKQVTKLSLDGALNVAEEKIAEFQSELSQLRREKEMLREALNGLLNSWNKNDEESFMFFLAEAPKAIAATEPKETA